MLEQTTLDTPIGAVRLVADGGALVGAWLAAGHRATAEEARPASANAVLDGAARELDEYFAGRRKAFSTPLATGGTAFQRRVWAALARIPFGARCSYAAVAVSIGAPRAVRAVGAANARNPLAIFVPCHRVVAADGGLCGYGGGLAAKRWLLDHERGC
ncbi:MAG TPA: methylated-DNA--[protein]-cysteine S-methyltransferase [Myxococcota bacterium]|jgi:methylated-DNA-[protein]-cysteine S-methyltransferase|nr:methylated-DNA--[protein]-cysteine S-methyltransferase [Myxococcota bacterium]